MRIAGRDVRRVADDAELFAGIECREPVARRSGRSWHRARWRWCARREASGDTSSAVTMRARPPQRQRDGNAAGTGADIENAALKSAGQFGERQINEQPVSGRGISAAGEQAKSRP